MSSSHGSPCTPTNQPLGGSVCEGNTSMSGNPASCNLGLSDRSQRKRWLPAVTQPSPLPWNWANIPAWQCPVQCIMGRIGHVGSHVVNYDDRDTKIVVNKKLRGERYLLKKARNQIWSPMFCFQRKDQWSRAAASKNTVCPHMSSVVSVPIHQSNSELINPWWSKYGAQMDVI